VTAARYALYFTPAPGTPLADLGAAVLEGDAPAGFSRDDWHAITAEPRRYGFHATLKAPFAPAAGATEDDLREALRAFAAGQKALEPLRLERASLGRFTALIPAHSGEELDAFAGRVVEEFDCWRAPLSEADRARRMQAPLSGRERRHLERWGYPYVFEDFRFHMTLAGPIPQERRVAVDGALRTLMKRHPGCMELRLDALTLLAEPERGADFHVVERAVFSAQ
jgi:hypothetical protein